jgi:hypothetical protein
MKLLMVGSGKGSFQMRGQQLGAALGARVTSSPSEADVRWADVVVLIKKHAVTWAPLVHRVGTPIVWDALDCWKQPAENAADARRGLALLQAQIKVIKPTLVIGATEAMARACGGVYLPHHSWSGLTPSPARDVTALVVGYEGNALYLGRWKAAIEQACATRGWRFVINPPDLRVVDLFVAFRDGPWDGWICREWKSGVKVVNAMAAGRPIITQDSAAERELQPIGTVIETPAQLADACAYWGPVSVRQDAVRAAAFTLEAVAAQYRQILETQVARCAA